MEPEFIPTKFKEAFVIKPKSFADDRGRFAETYNVNDFKKNGINEIFVQDNFSFSRKNVLRGMHFQKKPHETSKLVQCVSGEIYDVIVDIRPDSPTFKKWEAFILSQENGKMLYVPKGFAHGFYVTGDHAGVVYKVDEFFYPECDGGISWNDPDIGISWPIEEEIVISNKDKNAPLLKDVLK